MISALDKPESTLQRGNRLQNNAQCAPDIGSHWLVKLGALSFMSPYLVLVLSGGNTEFYRIAQFAWLILALLSILRFRKTRSPPSLTFLTLLSILVFGSVVSIIGIATGLDQTTEALQKIGALILILLYFDGFRFLGLNFYFERFKLSAALIILASIVHFLKDPSVVNGRHLFFGMHPNLGGEFLFVSVICIALLRSKVAFLLLTILALVGMYYLQSRSALLGTIFFLAIHLFLPSGLLSFSKQRFSLIILLGGYFSGLLLLIVFVIFSLSPSDIVNWISNDIMLIHDKFRGIGSGISGRVEITAISIEIFSMNPLLGQGTENAFVNETGTRVHSGPLLLLVEFGVLGIVPSGILMLALARSFRRNSFACSTLAGSLVLFIFQARGFNLNIFPLLMWIIALPWPTTNPRLK